MSKRFRKDTSKWKQMKRNLSAKRAAIDLGWFNGQMHDSGRGILPAAQLAKWIEEGLASNNQPPRPFIRTKFIPAIADSKELIKKALPYIDSVAQGKMSWKGLHQQIASEVLADFKLAIEIPKTPSNKPSTIKSKGFNDPWIETGGLVSSARYRITEYQSKPSVTYRMGSLAFNV